MGSVDPVPYWQVIVVTLETVIASIELAAVIMQECTQTSTVYMYSTCFLRRRGCGCTTLGDSGSSVQ